MARRVTIVTIESDEDLGTRVVQVARMRARRELEPETHVVLLVHGIRTEAAWQEVVAGVLEEDTSIEAIPLRYGYFDAFRFWFPFTRWHPIRRLLREIRDTARLYPASRLSIMAHSFGTYAIGKIFNDNTDTYADRLILCGGILQRDFRWDRIGARLKEKVINECGTRDVWPALAHATTWGYAATGTFGFGTVRVKDRFHDFKHSDYFDAAFVRRFWYPWIRHGTFVKGGTPRPVSPLWLRVLARLPLRYPIAGLLLWGLLRGAGGLLLLFHLVID